MRKITIKNHKPKITKCSLLTAFVGVAVHGASGSVLYLTRCVCMLLHKTANISDECVQSFRFKKEDKNPFVFVRMTDKIRALKKMCAEYPDLISNEKLNELVKIIKDGFRARHFLAHTMMVENDDGTVTIYEKNGLKMEPRNVTMEDLFDQNRRAREAANAIKWIHDRTERFLQ